MFMFSVVEEQIAEPIANYQVNFIRREFFFQFSTEYFDCSTKIVGFNDRLNDIPV